MAFSPFPPPMNVIHEMKDYLTNRVTSAQRTLVGFGEPPLDLGRANRIVQEQIREMNAIMEASKRQTERHTIELRKKLDEWSRLK